MSEKVLGFKKQKTICHYCDKLGEPKMLTFLCKDCVKIPIFDKKDKIKLVPIVSVEWLEKRINKRLKELNYNPNAVFTPANQRTYELQTLLSAVRKQAKVKK